MDVAVELDRSCESGVARSAWPAFVGLVVVVVEPVERSPRPAELSMRCALVASLVASGFFSACQGMS